ncbi:hypothetical protein CFP56_028699 [Quercus suber]|uniref:Uncharacterized protein n=1 Tax=Quercus suber TaxID=58331 RepID=A0AAW0LUU7_QUESU
MCSEVEGLDQEKKGMECLPLPLSLVDFIDAHNLFDENPSLAAPGDQEDIAEKMAYEIHKKMRSEVEGLDQEKKGMECLPLPLSLVDFVDAHHLFDENLSLAAPASPSFAAASSSSSSSSSPNNLLLSELNNSWTFAQMWIDFFM